MPRLEVAPVRLALRAPLRDGVGRAARARAAARAARLVRRRLRPRRGGAARALRRRAARRRWRRRSTPTARCCATPGRTPTTPTCSPRARPSATCPQALAAIDLALWDRVGPAHAPAGRAPARRRRRRRVCRSTRRLGAEDRAGAAAQAAAAARAGFGCVKVKVGDRRRRGRGSRPCAPPSGPDMAIRVDANGAWSTPQRGAREPARARARRARVRRGAGARRRRRCARCAPPRPCAVAMDETAPRPARRRRARPTRSA